MLIINDWLAIPMREFEFTYARSSGAGGQNVNKVNSKAILAWRPLVSPSLPAGVRDRFLARFGRRLSHDGSIVVQSDRFRDQPRNVNDCLEKLRLMILEVAVPPKKRRKTKPTRASREKRLEKKRRQSAKKRDRRWNDG
jgi:ribosome-associated protein